MIGKFVAIESGDVCETKELSMKMIADYLRSWANAFDGDYIDNPEFVVVNKIIFEMKITFEMKDGEETISIKDGEETISIKDGEETISIPLIQ